MTITLQALATITRHGGSDQKYDVAAAATPRLVEALKTHSKNPKVVHLIITILSHTVAPMYNDEGSLYKKFPSVKLQEIFPAVHTALCDDGPTPETFNHATLLIMGSARYGHTAMKKHQPTLDFIVGCLRVRDLATRTKALNSILTFHLNGSNMKPVIKNQDPLRHAATLQRLPDHLQRAIFSHGPRKCEHFLFVKSIADYQKAQMEAVQTKDFCQLGIKIAELIYLSEYAVAEGYFQDQEGIRRDVMGVPYDSFVGALPVAARALRERDAVKYADTADILQIKFCMIRRQYEAAE